MQLLQRWAGEQHRLNYLLGKNPSVELLSPLEWGGDADLAVSVTREAIRVAGIVMLAHDLLGGPQSYFADRPYRLRARARVLKPERLRGAISEKDWNRSITIDLQDENGTWMVVNGLMDSLGRFQSVVKLADIWRMLEGIGPDVHAILRHQALSTVLMRQLVAKGMTSPGQDLGGIRMWAIPVPTQR